MPKKSYPPLEEITKDVYVEEDFAELERKKGTKVVNGQMSGRRTEP